MQEETKAHSIYSYFQVLYNRNISVGKTNPNEVMSNKTS